LYSWTIHACHFLHPLFMCWVSPLQLPKAFGMAKPKERSAQSVNKMWIELVFVPRKSSFDPFGSIWTHDFSTFQDGSNQAYWVHVIWSQLLEDELPELSRTFHFYRSMNNIWTTILHHQNTIVLYMSIHYNSHQSKADVACIFFVYESGFSSVHPSWLLDKPYPLWELRIVIFLFCFVPHLLSSLVFLRCMLFEKELVFSQDFFFPRKVAYKIVVLGNCT
jgi:hypothetical protein